MDVSNQAFASLLPFMITDRNVRTFLSKQPADLASNPRVSANDKSLLVRETIHAALVRTEPRLWRHQRTTSDENGFPGDVLAQWTCKIEHCPGNVLCHSDTTPGDGGSFSGDFLLSHSVARLGCVSQAGGNRIDGDVIRGELKGKGFCESQDTGFARVVVTSSVCWKMSRV